MRDQWLPSLTLALGLIVGGCMPEFESGWQGDDDSAGDDDTGDDDTGDDDTTEGDVPDIEIVPEALNFDSAPVGVPTASDLLVKNVGTSVLTVFEVTVAKGHDGGGVIAVEKYPIFQVNPGDAQPLEGIVVVTCLDLNPVSGWVQLYSDDPDENPAEVGVGVVCVSEEVEEDD
ncbi:MAG: hypothetical protein QGH45_19535 [Myxococcota bacterium]|nr:hypothetical protein [Myxococcota bacterium]